MKSPCIKICVMDAERGWCKGCFRTLDEIGRWGGMTDAERDEILSSLNQRKESPADGSDVAKVSVPPLS